MRKYLIVFELKVLLILIYFFSSSAVAQERNVVLEYCAGTWCSYCTNATDVIENSILTDYPNTIILAYHGWDGSTDPFSDFYGKEIINLLNFNNYPTGRIDRTGDALPEYSWFNSIEKRTDLQSEILINIDKLYEDNDRTLILTVEATALTEFKDELILTLLLVEDNLVYPQAISEEPGIDSNYVHNNVVRSVISDVEGDSMNGESIWSENEIIMKNYSLNIEEEYFIDDCRIVALISRSASNLYEGEILQAVQTQISNSPSAIKDDIKVSDYIFLKQNFPNPFNPSTTIQYSIYNSQNEFSKTLYVSLVVYDILGRKVQTLVNDEQPYGEYSVNFDGTNLPSGIYFCTLEVIIPGKSGLDIQTKKLALLK